MKMRYFNVWILLGILLIGNSGFAKTNCGSTGMPACEIGEYCKDNTCQVCNVPDHCGDQCLACPTTMPKCYLKKCVECVTDLDCEIGLYCYTSTCEQPIPCQTNKDCASLSGRICDDRDHVCVNPPIPCTQDSMCIKQLGQICNKEKQVCYTPIMTCSFDHDCLQNQYCDTGEKRCKHKLSQVYTGGLSGCTVGNNSSADVGICLLLGTWLLGSFLLIRFRNKSASVTK